MIKPPPSPVKKSLKEKVVTYYDAIFEVRFLYYFLVKTFVPELSKIISSEKKKKKKKSECRYLYSTSYYPKKRC